ncbi:MAG: peptidoglycan-N-acetylglucosamine deacetylase, partial [Thermoleophilaceae bacterium]|nr:peptidoglycan-N-acetylglucosamine deacetylase [Thermoleophilaceae bacterium]
MVSLERLPWSRLAIAAPGVAAAVVAVVGLVGGPARTRHEPRPAQLHGERRGAAPGAGTPPPLVAGGRRVVRVPRRLTGAGPFLTVDHRVARMSPAPRPRHEVALTFDDGPGPLTRAFLHRLRRLHAKASFFVVGYAVRQRPRVLRRERAMGMTIGNHSLTHPPMRSLGGASQRLEIAAAEDLIQRTIGYRPLFFRPPDLSFNLLTAREIAAAGMVGALYTVDTRDWARPGVRRIVRRALQVRPGGVIAMHD